MSKTEDVANDRTSQVDFYYDFSSPYSYLGATQIERVAREHGATIAWKPFLLGALFKAIGTPIVPIAAMPEPRRRYQQRDVIDWAAYWGVPFAWPSRFPMRTVLPLRLVLAVEPADLPRLTHAIYRAYWVEDRDISDAAVLRPILDELGLDPRALERAEHDPAVKQRLIELGAEAERAGACGAPTFVVRGHVFWGQDRLELVAAALDGWEPPTD